MATNKSSSATSSGISLEKAHVITEFRIVLPLSVEEYQVAQLWSTAEMSKENTGGNEGVEILVNEPFEKSMSEAFLGKYNKGQYTKKIYHLGKRVPSLLRSGMRIKTEDLNLHEDAHNAYPYCRTVLTNPAYMKDKMFIDICSLHLSDHGEQDNVHHLSGDELSKRKVVYINIAEPGAGADPKADPETFKSTKTGRGPLSHKEPWQKTCEPYMCCYKLVRAKFAWWGLGGTIEGMIMKQEERLFRNFHRKLFCWMDKWYGLTMQDIRALEAAAAEELKEGLTKGETKGLAIDEKDTD